jgi:hypothetical protein
VHLLLKEVEEEEEVSVDPPSGPQQGTKVYVRNLPWTCDNVELAELCLDVGTVEAGGNPGEDRAGAG